MCFLYGIGFDFERWILFKIYAQSQNFPDNPRTSNAEYFKRRKLMKIVQNKNIFCDKTILGQYLTSYLYVLCERPLP